MKLFKIFLMMMGLFFTSALVAAENGKDDHKPLSGKEAASNCKELIANHCGDKNFEECMKIKDPKSGKVGECVSIVVRNREMFDLNDLNPNFQSLVKDLNDKGKDAEKCIQTSKMVCGDNVELPTCLKNHAGRFPSYCLDMARDRVDKMQAVYDSDPKVQGCTAKLMKQCRLDLGSDTETDIKILMAGMAKYKDCLTKVLPQTIDCSELVKVDRKTPPSPSVQTINQ